MDSEEQLKYEGVPVRIGNQTWVLPSLSVGQAKKLWPKLLSIDNVGGSVEEIKKAMPEKFDDMVAIIHAALSRNYKDISLEQLADIVSISQVKHLLLVVSGQSGFTPEGEPKPVELRRAVH